MHHECVMHMCNLLPSFLCLLIMLVSFHCPLVVLKGYVSTCIYQVQMIVLHNVMSTFIAGGGVPCW